MSDLNQMSSDWLARIEAAADLPALEQERVAALGVRLHGPVEVGGGR